MTKILRTLSLVAAIPIAACQTAAPRDTDTEAEAQRIAHDRVLCAQYGFTKGAEDFGHCMQVLAQRRAQNASRQPPTADQQEEPSDARRRNCKNRDAVVVGSGEYADKERNKEDCGGL